MAHDVSRPGERCHHLVAVGRDRADAGIAVDDHDRSRRITAFEENLAAETHTVEAVARQIAIMSSVRLSNVWVPVWGWGALLRPPSR